MTLASRALAVALFGAVVGATAIVGAPSASAAQAVYRWVDANGVVHFTQTAPRDVPYEQVSPSGQGSRPAPSFYSPRRDAPAAPANPDAGETEANAEDPALTAAQQQRQAELDAQAQTRLSEMAAARRRNCELARQQFEEFTTFARIRVADGEGGVRILTEAERAERIAEAEEAILVNCDDAG